MDATYRTPSWLFALLTLVITACVVVFGFLLFQHARKAALEEQFQTLRVEAVHLRLQEGNLKTELGQDGPLAKQLQKRVKYLDEVSNESTAAMADTKMLIGKGLDNATAIKDSLEKAANTRKTLEQEAKGRREELAQVETQLVANERDFENNLGKLRDQIATLSREVETVRKKNLQEGNEINLRIAELQERIVELTRQREIANRDAKADGKIMEADSTMGFVIIDIGRQQALRKGTKFTVYNRQGGRTVFKGLIEVSDVQERIATCRVLEEKDPNNPLVPNDLIANPMFDPAKVKGFAIRGSFRRFSKDELKRFILESGGRYDEEPGVSTDFLVAGENAEESLLQANKLGITILSEEQLHESHLFRLPVGKAEK